MKLSELKTGDKAQRGHPLGNRRPTAAFRPCGNERTKAVCGIALRCVGREGLQGKEACL